mgnify:CR=1 FL=1
MIIVENIDNSFDEKVKELNKLVEDLQMFLDNFKKEYKMFDDKFSKLTYAISADITIAKSCQSQIQTITSVIGSVNTSVNKIADKLNKYKQALKNPNSPKVKKMVDKNQKYTDKIGRLLDTLLKSTELIETLCINIDSLSKNLTTNDKSDIIRSIKNIADFINKNKTTIQSIAGAVKVVISIL